MYTQSASRLAVLPRELQPRTNDNLVRIGREYDGGYLVDGRDIDGAESLVSFGINADWSFEDRFLQRNDVPLYAFDGTISEKKFIRYLLESAIFRFLRPTKALYWWRTVNRYRRFFQGRRIHFQKMVGMDQAPDVISLSTVFEKFLPRGASRIFFKIDIEGSEYRLLDELVKFSDRIEGLVIEFHDVDLHLERIREFITRFPLQLCHTHCNNFAAVDNNRTPLVIELTFTSKPLAGAFAEKLPHPLDMANNEECPDYPIAFA